MLYYRMELLKKWKEREGFRATYEELVRALLQIGNAEDAEFIVALLAGMQTPAELFTLSHQTVHMYV